MVELNLILWKGYCILLGVYLLINVHCNSKIKELERRERQYNLISMSYKLELTPEEAEKLNQLMYFYNYKDENKFIRDKLKEVI